MSDRVYRAVVFAGVGVLMLILLRLRFGYALEAPEPPPSTLEMYGQEPSVVEPLESVKTRKKKDAALDTALYAQYLASDSEKYGIVPAATPGAMARHFAYSRESTERELIPNTEPINVLGLRLSVNLTDLPNTAFRQFDLRIENTRSMPVAYRIQTRPSVNAKVCYRKQDIPHNAVALRSRGVETRSECVQRDGWTLTLTDVEVLELNDLGFAYVSQVTPVRLGLDSRTSRGHRSPNPDVQICNVVHSATVEAARDRGEIGWRDLVDFFARHRCDTYAFPPSYRAIEKSGAVTLPYVR